MLKIIRGIRWNLIKRQENETAKEVLFSGREEMAAALSADNGRSYRSTALLYKRSLNRRVLSIAILLLFISCLGTFSY